MKGGSKKTNSVDPHDSEDDMPDLVDPDEDDSRSSVKSTRAPASVGKDIYRNKKLRTLVNNALDAAKGWFNIPVNDREQHYQVVRVHLMAPFLFAHVFQPDKWLRWAKDVGLWKERRLEIGGLSEDDLQMVDVIGAAAELLEGDVKNAFMLEELLMLMDTVESFRLVKTGVAPTRENVWVSLSMKKLGEKFSKLPQLILHAAVLFATRQYTEHIKKLMFEGKDVKEEFLNTCQEDEARSATLKDKGNQYFNEGNYEAAISSYQQAIYMNPFNHILYSNRAFSYLKTERLRLALADAKRCVVLRVDWEKGHYRYAQALFELGYYEKALEANLNGQRCCKSHSDLDRQYQIFNESHGKTKNKPAPNTAGTKSKPTQNGVAEKTVILLQDDDDVPELVSDVGENSDEENFSDDELSGSCDISDKGSMHGRTTASEDDIPELVDEDVDSDVGGRYSDDNMDTEMITDKKNKKNPLGSDNDASQDLPDLISETSSESDIDDAPGKKSTKPATTIPNHDTDSERIHVPKEKEERERSVHESLKREAERRRFEEEQAELRKLKREERREQKRRHNDEQVQAEAVTQSAVNLERLAVQAQLNQGTQQMLSGKWRNSAHHFMQCLQAARCKDTLTQQEMVVLLYALARANIEHGEHNTILEGLEHLDSIKNEFQDVMFPLVYHGLATAQCKQNNFAEALIPIEEGLGALERCGGQSATCFWPGTEMIIEESRAENLAAVFRDLRAVCLNPPKPDAVCRYFDCRSRVQIYHSDLDFKGYIRVLCSDTCHIDYHPICWRRVRSLHPTRTGEKDMLTEGCLTPDCPGLLTSISIIDESGKVKKAFHADETELAAKLNALKPAPPAVATSAGVKKKTKQPSSSRKRERREKDDDEPVAVQASAAGTAGKVHSSRGEDPDISKGKVNTGKTAAPLTATTANGAKSEETDVNKSKPNVSKAAPPFTAKVSVISSASVGSSVSAATKADPPGYSSQTSSSSTAEDPSQGTVAAAQLEKADLVVLKRDDIPPELIAPQTKSRTKAKKKKVKGKQTLDVFRGSLYHGLPDGSPGDEDDGLITGPSSALMTPVEQVRPSVPPVSYAMSLPGVKSSTDFPHLGQEDGATVDSESQAHSSVVESVSEERNVVDNTYSFFAEILRYEGPLNINDTRLQEPLTTMLPDNTRQQIEEIGGLHVFLESCKDQFLFHGNVVCLKENAQSLENEGGGWEKRPPNSLNVEATEFVPRAAPLPASETVDGEQWSNDAENIPLSMGADMIPPLPGQSVMHPFPVPPFLPQAMPGPTMMPSYPYMLPSHPSDMHPVMPLPVPAEVHAPSELPPVVNGTSSHLSPAGFHLHTGNVTQQSEAVLTDSLSADVGVKMAEDILSSSPAATVSSRKSSVHADELEEHRPSRSSEPSPQAGLLVVGRPPVAQRYDSVSSTIESYPVHVGVQTPASFDVYRKQCQEWKEKYQEVEEQNVLLRDQQVQQKKRFELELDRIQKLADDAQQHFVEREGELNSFRERHENDLRQITDLKLQCKEKLRVSRERVKEADAKEEKMRREIEQLTEDFQQQMSETHREREEYTKRMSGDMHNLESTLQQTKQRALVAELQVVDMRREHRLREVEAYIQQSNVSLAYIQRLLSSGHGTPQLLEQQQQFQQYLQELNRCGEAVRSQTVDMRRSLESGKELSSLPRLTVPLPPRPRFAQPARPMVPPGGMGPSAVSPGGLPPVVIPGMPGHVQPPGPAGPAPLASEGERPAMQPANTMPGVQPDSSHGPLSREPKSKNSFQKIMSRLSEMFPQSTQPELTTYIKKVRAENNNSLSGISLEEIIRRVAVIVQKKGAQQQRPQFANVGRGGLSPQLQHVSITTGGARTHPPATSNLTPVDVDSEDDFCIICHEEMTVETSTHLECHHRFHTECIRKWFMEQSTCPTCRVHSLMPDEYPALS